MKVKDFALDLSDGEKVMGLIAGLFETLSSAVHAFETIKGEIDKGKPENAAKIAVMAADAHSKAVDILLSESATEMSNEQAEALIESRSGAAKH